MEWITTATNGILMPINIWLSKVFLYFKSVGAMASGVSVKNSNEIAAISLHSPLPALLHLYVYPFLVLYPFAAWIYLAKYNEYLGDQANTFIGCVLLFGTHALSWLATRWSMSFRAAVTAYKVGCSAANKRIWTDVANPHYASHPRRSKA